MIDKKIIKKLDLINYEIEDTNIKIKLNLILKWSEGLQLVELIA